MRAKDNQILVIFGASGDLTEKKLLPALYNLHLQNFLPEKFYILGVSRKEYTDESFRSKILASNEFKSFSSLANHKKSLQAFIAKLHYISIDTSNPDDYEKVRDKLFEIDKKHSVGRNFIYYYSTPPSLFYEISKNLAKHNLNKEGRNGLKNWKRIIIEKPFGYDLKTAIELNNKLQKFFRERQIYRIDHYLGKETVQNIMVTRFSNIVFEPIWNRNYIDHVQITSAEDIGVGLRGGYYDNAGAMRDMVQNHLLQLAAMVAMEPPSTLDSNSIRNETAKVFQSIRPYSEEDIAKYVIRGQYSENKATDKQYNGYTQENGVPKTSKTETFVALKFFVDNWRWKDVPFFIRTGKRLPSRVTEIVIHFKPTPHQIFYGDNNTPAASNQLVIRIQPDEGQMFRYNIKIPGAGFRTQDVGMDFHYSELANSYLPTAYERLILDCMTGDATLYARADAVENTWKFITPILDAWQHNPHIPLHEYKAGSWGPSASDRLITSTNFHWRNPCKNLDSERYCEL